MNRAGSPTRLQMSFFILLAAHPCLQPLWPTKIKQSPEYSEIICSNSSVMNSYGPLTFLAMVMPMLKDRPAVAAALSAAAVAVLAHGLPYNLSLIVAATIGIGTGLFSEARS